MTASFHIPSSFLFTVIQSLDATRFELLVAPLYKLQLNNVTLIMNVNMKGFTSYFKKNAENYSVDMQLAYVYLESVSKRNHLPDLLTC
jgi:hypothetical protein